MAGCFVDVLFAVLLLFCFLSLVVLPAVSWVNARVLIPRRMRRLTRQPSFTVNVIVPCYGRSDSLAHNLLAIVRQDYPNYSVTFVTDTADDAAVPDIRAVMAQASHARHLVAGYSETCGQKNHVQLAAIASDATSDIFVICDSDLRPRPDWLRELVRPFVDPGVAVTTSARWITPPRLGLGPLIYTGMSSYWPMILANPLFPMLWGGCFAISRTAFEELGVRELWGKTEDDDMVLSNRLAERRRRPVFVPSAVSLSHESHGSVRYLVRWFIRLSLTGRIHSLPAWLFLLAGESLLCVGFLASLALLVAHAASGAVDHRSLFAPVLLALVTLNVLLVKGPYWRMKDMPFVLWLLAPVPSHYILCFAIWRSVFVRTMSWGAVQYEFNRDGTIRKLSRAQKPAAKNGSPVGEG
jgi:cellulose synthase/poly-beta-1,6-N-acetylglucosamine synthase-like glycosyltransferase